MPVTSDVDIWRLTSDLSPSRRLYGPEAVLCSVVQPRGLRACASGALHIARQPKTYDEDQRDKRNYRERVEQRIPAAADTLASTDSR
jgi:hypothetical protein